jgi:tetratricopeptide (TPR) repeat protein
MTMRAAVAIVVAALAGCAQLPAETGPAPASAAGGVATRASPASAAHAAAIVRQSELSKAASDGGDHAAALAHNEVLMLLDPGNPAHRRAAEAARALIERGVREQVAAGGAARRAGDAARARDAYLRALALDPRNAEAAAALREIEHQQMARTQADRAARARSMETVVANARSRAQAQSQAESYDLEQRLELMRSADPAVGLREARAWVEANAGDREGRNRLAAAAAERARDAERKGQRESALSLYEGANALAAAPSPEWTARARELRRALGDAQYAEGMRVMRADLAAAIRHFEASVRYDPDNAKAQERLRDARAAQEKLRRIAPR